MSNWVWTPEQLELLATDWANNRGLAIKSRIQRMTEFHLCQPDDVRAGLKQLGIDPDAPPNPAKKHQPKQLVGAAKAAAMAKLEAGIPAAEVAEIYGISLEQAENLARRAPEKASHRPGPVTVTKVEPADLADLPGTKKQRRRYDRETIAAVTGDVIDGGLTYAQAAEKHGVSVGGLHVWVKKRTRAARDAAAQEGERMHEKRDQAAGRDRDPDRRPPAQCRTGWRCCDLQLPSRGCCPCRRRAGRCPDDQR